MKEFVAGGVADQLFGHEGTPDSWKLVDLAYLNKQPPDGPGMECSNMVTFGYAQVEATASSLKVVLKDTRGSR